MWSFGQRCALLSCTLTDVGQFGKRVRVEMQYVEFLSTSLPRKDYQALLPPLSELVLEYKVDPEVAFHVSGSPLFCAKIPIETMPHWCGQTKRGPKMIAPTNRKVSMINYGVLMAMQ